MVRLVVDHNVVSGRDAALPDRLRHQEVIEVVASGDGVIQNGARVRVFQVVTVDLGGTNEMGFYLFEFFSIS